MTDFNVLLPAIAEINVVTYGDYVFDVPTTTHAFNFVRRAIKDPLYAGVSACKWQMFDNLSGIQVW